MKPWEMHPSQGILMKKFRWDGILLAIIVFKSRGFLFNIVE
jgi:hypothetical protein